MTVSGVLPLLIRFWLMAVPGVTLFEHPLIFGELVVKVQVNKVPVTPEVRDILVLLLLQIDSESGVVVRLGVGKTVTT